MSEIKDSFCIQCDLEGKYNGTYDAWGCPTCKEWVKPKCSEAEECLFCDERPEKYVKYKKKVEE